MRNFVSLVSVARITLSATIPKTARAVVCKQAYTTALSIFTILADSCYSRKRLKPKVYTSRITCTVLSSRICTPLPFCTHLSSKGSSRCASQKKPLWDSSKTYSPKGFTFRDVQLMLPFHDKCNRASYMATHTHASVAAYICCWGVRVLASQLLSRCALETFLPRTMPDILRKDLSLMP